MSTLPDLSRSAMVSLVPHLVSNTDKSKMLILLSPLMSPTFVEGWVGGPKTEQSELCCQVPLCSCPVADWKAARLP